MEEISSTTFNTPTTRRSSNRWNISQAYKFWFVCFLVAMGVSAPITFTVLKTHLPITRNHRLRYLQMGLSNNGRLSLFEANAAALSNMFSKFTESTKQYLALWTNPPKGTPYYDYIVVGGGAAGCPLAFTLSEAGFSVLLVERGPERSYAKTPGAMDIYGAGMVIGDPTVSQRVVTSQGVHTHIGSVMGGGSSINMAIYIEEVLEYFEFLQNSFPNVQLDLELIKQSFAWVDNRTSSRMPYSDAFSEATKEGLEYIGIEPYTDDTSAEVAASKKLRIANFWSSFSLFNSSNYFYRNAADVLLLHSENATRPKTLTVLTDTMVEKVEFNKTDSSENSRATCIVYHTTDFRDVPLMSGKPFNTWRLGYWKSLWENFVNPLGTVFNSFNNLGGLLLPRLKRACIKSDGEIILSAGAIPSTILLFKSGVGPRRQIAELQLPLVRDIPELGQNFSDRVLIPAAVFLKDKYANLRQPFSVPRVSPYVGLNPNGPECDNFSIGEKKLTCTLTSFESLFGSRIAEGIIYSTRFVFPPEWRDEPIVDFIFSTLRSCATLAEAFLDPVLGPLCKLLNPVERCFRRAYGLFYFTTEPKSRGSIKLKGKDIVEIKANYLRDTQDLFDAIRGASNLIEVINSDVYRSKIEPIGPNSCPITILNGLLNLVLQFGSFVTTSRPEARKNLREVKEHLEYLIREQNNLLRNYGHQRDEDNFGDNGLNSEEQELKLMDASISPAVREELKNHWEQLSKYYKEEFKDGKSSEITSKLSAEHDFTRTTSCNLGYNANDPYYYFKEKLLKQSQSFAEARSNNLNASSQNISHATASKVKESSQQSLHETASDELRSLHKSGHNSNKTLESGIKEFLNDAISSNLESPRDQWAATYPPRLPEKDNPVALARYALTYMTSIWHHTGTSPMGTVVSSNFSINGLSGISIVDAGVLNQVPRVNPTATILMLGRYAGLIKRKQRSEATPSSS